MTKIDEEIDLFLKNESDSIFKNFENIVNINSFSQNLEGIQSVYDYLKNLGEKHNITLKEKYSTKRARPHLMFQDELEQDFFAFIGHVDTVHPPKSDFNSIKESDGRYIGPGTNDMKSGVIVALYSLILLKKLFPDKTLPIKALFNSDEEIGSFDSKEIIEKSFKNALAGFVFEPGRLPGYKIVTSRKGVFNMVVNITGKPSHAGVDPEGGINAISAACEIIGKLNKLNDFEAGTTIGCNVISGGVAVNVVAPFCKIDVDGRYLTKESGKKLLESIDKILKEPNSVGAKVEYEIPHLRPPFEKSPESEELYKKYKAVCDELGVECDETTTGGGSDANFLSSMGVPSLDGLGAVGDFSHTKKEFTIKRTILEKIKITTFFMSKLMESYK